MKTFLTVAIGAVLLAASTEAQDHGRTPASAESSAPAAAGQEGLPPLRIQDDVIVHDLSGRLRGSRDEIERQRAQKAGLVVAFWKDRPVGQPLVEWVAPPGTRGARGADPAKIAELERRGRVVLDAFLNGAPSLSSDGHRNQVMIEIEASDGEDRVTLSLGDVLIILDSHPVRSVMMRDAGATSGGCRRIHHPGGEALTATAPNTPLPHLTMEYTGAWAMAERVMSPWGREIAALYAADCASLLAAANG